MFVATIREALPDLLPGDVQTLAGLAYLFLGGDYMQEGAWHQTGNLFLVPEPGGTYVPWGRAVRVYENAADSVRDFQALLPQLPVLQQAVASGDLSHVADALLKTGWVLLDDSQLTRAYLTSRMLRGALLASAEAGGELLVGATDVSCESMFAEWLRAPEARVQAVLGPAGSPSYAMLFALASAFDFGVYRNPETGAIADTYNVLGAPCANPSACVMTDLGGEAAVSPSLVDTVEAAGQLASQVGVDLRGAAVLEDAFAAVGAAASGQDAADIKARMSLAFDLAAAAGAIVPGRPDAGATSGLETFVRVLFSNSDLLPQYGLGADDERTFWWLVFLAGMQTRWAPPMPYNYGRISIEGSCVGAGAGSLFANDRCYLAYTSPRAGLGAMLGQIASRPSLVAAFGGDDAARIVYEAAALSPERAPLRDKAAALADQATVAYDDLAAYLAEDGQKVPFARPDKAAVLSLVPAEREKTRAPTPERSQTGKWALGALAVAALSYGGFRLFVKGKKR